MQNITLTRPIEDELDAVAAVVIEHLADVVAGSSQRAVQDFTAATEAVARREGLLSPTGLPVDCDVTFTATLVAGPRRPGIDPLLVQVQWHPTSQSRLLPVMQGTLVVERRPLAADGCQLLFQGSYEPPGGLPGRLADRMVGRHLTEATVHGWLADVAGRTELHLRAQDGRDD